MGRLNTKQFQQLLSRHPEFKCGVYIETGLWKGEQLLTAAPHFEAAHGIELSAHWAAVSESRVSKLSHVTVHHGDTLME